MPAYSLTWVDWGSPPSPALPLFLLTPTSPLLPKRRILNPQLDRIKCDRPPGLELPFVIAQTGDGRARDEEDDQDADDVNPRHHAHADIAEVPDIAGAVDGAEHHHRHDQQLDDDQRHAALEVLVQVSDIGFGDIVIGDDGGKGEEEQRQRHEDRAETAEGALQRHLRERGRTDFRGGRQVLDDELAVRQGALHVVLVGDQNHQRGGGAHQQGIDIDRERLHQALLRRVLGFGSGGSVGAGALPRFVRVHAALDAPADGRAHAGLGRERIREDQREYGGQLVDIHGDDDQRQHDVAEGHERHHVLGKLGDALDAAKNDDAQYQQDHRQAGQLVGADAAHEGVDHGAVAKDLGDRVTDRVGLHAGQEDAAGNHRRDGKQRAQPGPAEAAREEVGGAATVLAVLFDLVQLAQRRFGIGRAGAQEGDRPHPEHRAGAAETDGGGHAGDIAHANPAGQGHGQGLERRDAGIGVTLLEQQAQHFLEQAHLDETGLDRIEQAGAKAQVNQGRTPDHAIQTTDKSFHRFFPCIGTGSG